MLQRRHVASNQILNNQPSFVVVPHFSIRCYPTTCDVQKTISQSKITKGIPPTKPNKKHPYNHTNLVGSNAGP